MKILPKIFAGALWLVSAASPAFGDDFDRDGVRGPTYCFPAKFAVKIIDKLGGTKSEQRDIVDINMDPQFLIYDDGGLPERYFLKKEGGAAVDFTVKTDGGVPDFLEIVSAADKRDDICITDPARSELDSDDESLYFEMGLTPYFHNNSGLHTLAELIEGAKDGKQLYKKMVPAPVRLFMPDTDHMSVRFDDPAALPRITAMKDGKPIGIIESQFYNEAHVFDCKYAEDLGADSVKIEGGAYRLAPVPSIKTMKRFGIGKPRGSNADVDSETTP